MTESADLLVVGAGTAGLCVAAEAARGGLRVVLLESSSAIGGTLTVSAGHMSAAGTRLQARHGIDDNPDLHYADVMEFGAGRADPGLVRLAVDEAPKTIDWLEDEGFQFDDGVPAIYRGHRPYSRPRTYWGRDKGRSILAVLSRHLDVEVQRGAVQLLTGRPMAGLSTTAGRVSGVVTVPTPEHPAIEIRAGVTVLACGGYGANPQLFAELTPGAPRLVTNAVPTSQGDGLVAAQAVGAGLHGGELHTPRLGLLETSPGRADMWSAMLELTPGDRVVSEIWVNSAGQRFAAEDAIDVTALEHAVLRQPGTEFWVVIDSASLDRVGSPVRQWDRDRFVAEAASGTGAEVVGADDLPTLAARAGIDPAGLGAAVTDYNAAVRGARDQFGRTRFGDPLERAPFYAVRTPAALLCSFAGVRVDTDLRVLTDAGAVVPGLYGVGEVLGMGATSGAAFCGGMSVTPALSFGRLLGQRLAGARSG